MTVAGIAAGIGAAAAVVGVVSSISAGNTAADNANAVNENNAEIEAQQKQYRLEIMKYGIDQYNQQIDHYGQEIDYEKSEFTRATKLIDLQKSNIDEDYTAKVGTELLKSVQQDVARSLQMTTIGAQGAQEHGKADVSAAERGVAGNSANIQSGEVSRQVGTAELATQRNFDAAQTQNKVEMLGLKAQHDSAIAGLQLPTFAPIAPPAPPAPVSPVNPAAPVSVPSAGSIAVSGLSSGLNLASSGVGIVTNINRITNPGNTGVS